MIGHEKSSKCYLTTYLIDIYICFINFAKIQYNKCGSLWIKKSDFSKPACLACQSLAGRDENDLFIVTYYLSDVLHSRKNRDIIIMIVDSASQFWVLTTGKESRFTLRSSSFGVNLRRMDTTENGYIGKIRATKNYVLTKNSLQEVFMIY